MTAAGTGAHARGQNGAPGSGARPYRGRFAPSPSGPLHLGSCVAAIASYLDARAHHGHWYVRIDDIDPPREMPGAADTILHELERLQLDYDDRALFQSTRDEAYRDVLAQLRERELLFDCACTRKMLPPGPYPGTCARGVPAGATPRSERVLVDNARIQFHDRIDGPQINDLAATVGSFVVRRADGLISYHLANVVDDAYLRISDVVRGDDLLSSTAPQIHLANLCGFTAPRYAHIPVVTAASGQKLSKQSRALSSATLDAPSVWRFALEFLGLVDDKELVGASIYDYKLVGTARWMDANA